MRLAVELDVRQPPARTFTMSARNTPNGGW
jgi:hypothetical protein